MINIAAAPQICPYCGHAHIATCPRIKAMEYHPDGSLKRVEFHEPQQTIGNKSGLDILCGQFVGRRSQGDQVGTGD